MLSESDVSSDDSDSTVTQGSDFQLDPLPVEMQQADLKEALERGNHKSARDRPEKLKELVLDDVVNGFSLPLPPKKIPLLPGAVIAPHGIAEQGAIDETGQIIKKDRLTHDMSFRFSSEMSFNDRTDLTKFDPVQFGDCLRRVIHYIVSLRSRHPHTRTYLAKFDWKSAYRRAHFNAKTAVQAITIVDGIAQVALRRVDAWEGPCDTR